MNADDVAVQVLPTAEALDGAQVLDEVLRDALEGHGSSDWAPEQLRDLWRLLESGGWDRLGADECDGGFGLGLRDLVEFALVLGRHLAPAPLSPSLASRSPGAAPTDTGPMTVAVPRRTRPAQARVVYGGFPGVLVTNTNRRPVASPPERFAPSLLLTTDESGRDASRLDERLCHRLVVLWAAESVGAAETLLARAVDYAKTRRQFGRVIGQFQAIKHLLADGRLAHQEALTATVQLANCDRPEPATTRLVFDRCMEISHTAGQVHGGIGMTWELGQHFYTRHIIALRDLVEDLLAQKGC